MGTRRKTVLKGFDYMHCDDFAKYLSNMAAKGWHFKEWGVGLKFEKGEREQAVYAVEVFSEASENDMRPEPNTREFAEYCEAAGWKFIDAKQKFCIFKKISEEAVALFTPEERVNNSVKGTFSGSAIALLVLYALNALLQWMNLGTSFEMKIFSGSFWFSFLIWNVLMVGQLGTFLLTMIKRGQLRKKIREGKEIYIGSRKDGKRHIGFRDGYVTGLFLLLLCYLLFMGRQDLLILNVVVVGVTIGFVVLINKIRPERESNIIIQIVFSVVVMLVLLTSAIIIIADNGENVSKQQEDFPVVIADYRVCNDEIESLSYYREQNLLGSLKSYHIFGKENSVYYRVYESKFEKLLDRVWKEEVVSRKYNEDAVDCTAEWAADIAIRNKLGTYYVRFDNKLLVFSDDESVYLSVEQIDVILDKLGLR